MGKSIISEHLSITYRSTAQKTKIYFNTTVLSLFLVLQQKIIHKDNLRTKDLNFTHSLKV